LLDGATQLLTETLSMAVVSRSVVFMRASALVTMRLRVSISRGRNENEQ
jgi:hypothetical protein